MSLNDKARAALKRELSRAFPERAANDPGHDRLAEALSKPTHTPGVRWYCGRPSNGDVPIIAANRPDCESWTVARAVGNCTDAELQANARLIAAAPELLEALKALADYVQRTHETPNNYVSSVVLGARAAIARAEGGAA